MKTKNISTAAAVFAGVALLQSCATDHYGIDDNNMPYNMSFTGRCASDGAIQPRDVLNNTSEDFFSGDSACVVLHSRSITKGTRIRAVIFGPYPTETTAGCVIYDQIARTSADSTYGMTAICRLPLRELVGSQGSGIYDIHWHIGDDKDTPMIAQSRISVSP